MRKTLFITILLIGVTCLKLTWSQNRILNRNTQLSQNGVIVLDLGGDGLELLSLRESRVFLDATQDGLFAELTGWIQPGEGLLALDSNENGAIDGFHELLEEFDGRPAVVRLKEYDTDGNDLIDKNDKDFSKLKVWTDINADGITNDGELSTVEESGISSIGLSGLNVVYGLKGHKVTHTLPLTFLNGSHSKAYNVSFKIDNAKTLYKGKYDLLLEALFLPRLRGSGETAHLHIAVSIDPELLKLVRKINLLRISQISQAPELVEQFMLKWSRVEDVDINSRGEGVNAQHLALVENRIGTDGLFAGMDMSGLASEMDRLWTILHEDTMIKLLAQTSLKRVFGKSSHSMITDNLTFKEQKSLSDVITKAEAFAPSDSTNAEFYWHIIKLILVRHAKQFNTTYDQVNQVIDTKLKS